MDRSENWFLYTKKSEKENKYKIICGVDEAGRGPLAGPVFSAAVVLSDDIFIEGINDSKKLSEKKREIIYNEIIAKAKSYSISFCTEKEIDKINILNATLLSMKKSIENLKLKPDLALIDGDKIPQNLKIESKSIIKGDSIINSIAAASILAKVSRDRFMKKISYKYPQYEFEKHKGYGTKLHIELIKRYGYCEIHRKSFLAKI